MTSTNDLPTLRWGIIATGMISSWFVGDLWMERPDGKANHIVQAIGSSSQEKGEAFVKKHFPGNTKPPTVYGSYKQVYSDPEVDIVYIGTPHAFHKENCLDAIKAGKHVLCEKAFTLNAKEAKEVFEAAKARGVFVMEAMWTRFFPLMRTLQAVLHSEKLIGTIRRAFCDFAMDMKLEERGPDSRLTNPALGAGTLLDVGVYSLTWTLLSLDSAIGHEASTPKITAVQSLSGSIDIASSALLLYADGKQGIVTTSAQVKTGPEFCRIEGTDGYILVEGLATSLPKSFTVYSSKGSGEGWAESATPGLKEKKYSFEGPGQRTLDEMMLPGKGFYYEADAVAQAIAAGQNECEIMPWAETIRVLEMMDEIRRQGGASFPQDDI